MNIILQNYNDLLKKLIFDTFSSNLKEKLDKIDINGNVMNYVDLLSNLDESLCTIARESLISIFEAMDKSFKLSLDRKKKYDIKSYHPRTIMTIFGEITFNRTFYTSKLNGKNYCYVDRILGLHKYDYFDPYLKALIISYAANNSYPKVAGYINDLIGNRIKIKSSFNYISRQTVRNVIMSCTLSKPNIEKLDTPASLYIIADEKWIHTQNNNKKDVMEKSVVVFEEIKNKKLKNKMIFASLDGSFLDNCLDYIYNVYDVNKIKTIFVLGDGAKWIKCLRTEFQFNKNIHTIQGLDKFHFKQALHHIALNIDLENILTDYVLKNNKRTFIECCDSLKESFPHRSETIENKKKYILNNLRGIKDLYKYNLSCPMESQISHNIADLFTSRPKAYSIKTIIKLTELRLLYKNKFNIKELFLNNFNSKEKLVINNSIMNFSMFDKKETFTVTTRINGLIY
jgi:hypothetical protein